MSELLREHRSDAIGETFREYLLGGRLRVVVHSRTDFRKTLAMAVARFGGCELVLPDGAPIPEGTAHFFEHRLFTKPEGDISQRFGALGMSPNAATGHCRTWYNFLGSDGFAEAVELLAELLFSPYFPEEEIAAERQIVEREIAETHEAPGHALFANLQRALFHSHPVRREILGTRQSLAQITAEMLHRCHRAFYCPENVVFYLHGGSETDQALERLEGFIEKRCGMPPGRAVPVPDVDEPRGVAAERVEVPHAVGRPNVAIGFKSRTHLLEGEAYLAESISTLVALELVFEAGSRWFEDAYSRGVIDGSFGASYVHDCNYGYVAVGGETEAPAELEAAVRARVREALGEGVAPEALRRVKRRLAGSFLRSFNAPEDALGLFANFHLVGADPLSAAEYAASLTLPQVHDALERALGHEDLSVAILAPRER